MSIQSDVQKPIPSMNKGGFSRVWQFLVGLVVFILAAVISVFEIVSQARKYKKASIPIEVYHK